MSEYDRIDYPTHVYPETHPDMLARTGVLFGMRPPAVDTCRVLEIGCGNGRNIIPMAFELRESEFVGIDLATGPIQDAQGMIRRTGLQNVAVRAMDVMDIGEKFGKFDYIIAHGIYSWVPKNVQDKILTICHDNLSPSGIAFVSFNTHPAGRIRQATSDIMKFHLRTSAVDTDCVREGKHFLKTLLALTEQNSVWKAVLGEEIERLSKRPDGVTFHDELSPVYSPVYFAEFATDAAHKGLQFLSDVNLSDPIDSAVNPKAAEILDRLSRNVVNYQQYLDYVTFRGFRRTLVCHSSIQLDRTHFRERIQALLVASPLMKSGEGRDGGMTFRNRRGSGAMTTDSPVVSSALSHLERIWPRAMPFSDLAGEVERELPETLPEDVPSVLSQAVLQLASSRLIDLRTYDVPVAARVADRPAATCLARLEAAEGSSVTTLMHTRIDIPQEQTRHLLQMLDGTRTVRALASAISARGRASSDEATVASVKSVLEDFRQMGLLVSEQKEKSGPAAGAQGVEERRP